jgi:hypothetical protein
MTRQLRFIVGALMLAGFWPDHASAQSLTLEFTNGLVTLHAENVSLREIIDRWSDQGGVNVSNREGISTAPITLHLVALPERQVLATLLRDVSGYILGPQRQGTASGATIDRILVLARSSPPMTVTSDRAVQPRRSPEPVVEVEVEEPPAPFIGGQDEELLVPDVSDPQAGETESAGSSAPDGTRGVTSGPFGFTGGSSDRPGTIAPVPPSPSGSMRSPSESR